MQDGGDLDVEKKSLSLKDALKLKYNIINVKNVMPIKQAILS